MSGEEDDSINMLLCMEPLREPLTQAIIAASMLQKGSRGLDLGCGIGLQTLMLAKAVGANGHVTGMDISASLLGTAHSFAGQSGFEQRVSFREGSWDRIPCDNAAFDWLWSMDAAGYASREPVGVVRELTRVVRPGGKLILGYWSSQCLLPGHPALEARLNASPAGIAPFQQDADPRTHFLYTLAWMRQVGLVNTHCQTFVHTVAAPLSPEERKALIELFAMRWGLAESDVSAEDWQTYLRLCRAGSPDLILDVPGYTAFFTYSVFFGTAPGG